MKCLFFTLFICVSSITVSHCQIISLFAGGGRRLSEGIPATASRIDEVQDIIFDSVGNLYYSDDIQHVIRKIDTSGIVKTIAGSFLSGSSGDGGPATSGRLSECDGILLKGNILYICDAQNNKIRAVNLITNIISTAFGNGSRIDSGDGRSAVYAGIRSPLGICSDNYGNIYVTGLCVIRKINATDSLISSICGSASSCGFNGDSMLATSAFLSYLNTNLESRNNEIYCCDFGNNRLRKIDTNSIIKTVAGISISGSAYYNGDYIRARNAMVRPSSIAVNSLGEIFIADNDNYRIRKIAINDTIYTIAGTGIRGYSGAYGRADTSKLGISYGIALDACDNLYFGDRDDTAGRIRKITYPYGNQPTITITQDDTQIPCYSLPVSFTASTRLGGRAPTYQWQVNGVNRGTSSPTFSYLPTHGDVVRCILRSNLYCVINPYDTSNELHVVVDSLTPPVLTIGGPSTATLSSTVPLSTTISGGSFSSYTLQWRNSGSLVATTTTPSYSYTKAAGTDTFTVTLTSIDRGCYDSATSAIHTVSLPVGFNNTASSTNTWEVYPNPAHQKLFIANKQLILGKLTIINSLGTEVYTTQSTGHQAAIDISALPVGVYTLSANNIFITKFTKE